MPKGSSLVGTGEKTPFSILCRYAILVIGLIRFAWLHNRPEIKSSEERWHAAQALWHYHHEGPDGCDIWWHSEERKHNLSWWQRRRRWHPFTFSPFLPSQQHRVYTNDTSTACSYCRSSRRSRHFTDVTPDFLTEVTIAMATGLPPRPGLSCFNETTSSIHTSVENRGLHYTIALRHDILGVLSPLVCLSHHYSQGTDGEQSGLVFFISAPGYLSGDNTIGGWDEWRWYINKRHVSQALLMIWWLSILLRIIYTETKFL